MTLQESRRALRNRKCKDAKGPGGKQFIVCLSHDEEKFSHVTNLAFFGVALDQKARRSVMFILVKEKLNKNEID